MRNISECTINGVALTPQNVNNSDVNGAAISILPKHGRRLLITMIAGAFAANDVINIRLQGRAKAANSWHNLEKADGSDPSTDPLAFDEQADAGALENGFIHGEIDLDRLQTPAAITALDDVMDAIRVVGINDVAQNVVVGGTFQIGGLNRMPPVDGNHDLEQLLNKQVWTTA